MITTNRIARSAALAVFGLAAFGGIALAPTGNADTGAPAAASASAADAPSNAPTSTVGTRQKPADAEARLKATVPYKYKWS